MMQLMIIFRGYQ